MCCNSRSYFKESKIAELKNLVDTIKDQKYLSPSIVVIGKIVNFKVNNNITKLSEVYLTDINQVQLYNNFQK